MRIALAQINPTVGDLSGNTALIKKGIDQAKESGAKLVVFPELSLTGYPPEDLLLMPHFIEATLEALQEIVAYSKEIATIVGLPRSRKLSAAVIDDQQLLGFHDKILLPTYDVFDERRFFDPGEHTPIWEIQGRRIAVSCCEDIWGRQMGYIEDPIENFSKQKPDLMINLSASPFNSQKPTVRFDVCAEAARALNCPLLYCNQVGGNDSLIFDGRSLYIDKQGNLIREGKIFESDFIVVDTSKSEKSILSKIDPIGDLYHALVLGVRDYFRKLGFKKACLGLSGGIDSALVACIAKEALGKENVLAILMPSRYSSEGSVTDSLELVKRLEIAHRKISIEKPFSAYLDLLQPKEGLTEENLQARVRGMILMATSNEEGYIVLSTGNKSELAMGYSTLYGDTCGGLNVLGDVTKSQVYALAKSIGFIPENIVEKPPSAELRPNQKDSDTLPDYAIIDTVLEEYISRHHSPKQIAKNHDYSIDLVMKIIKAIHTNEYKRRQGAPLLSVSERTFSIGRRFPIVHKWDH